MSARTTPATAARAGSASQDVPARQAGAAPAARTRAQGKRSAGRKRALQRRQPRLSRLLAWLLSAVLGSAGLAYAQVPAGTLPAGGTVVVGAGQVQQSNKLLIINQSSARLGMDWQSFNIGSAASVEFRQPDAGSVALNRVLGHSGSQIFGQLRSNGQVFLINPHGVLFAPGSKVDVGGLVATTMDLSQQDFASGRFVFTATGAQGAVVNQGSLRASAGGYLALMGQHVDNQGDLTVDAGAVVLASGRAATVSISGNGLISAVVTPGDAGSVGHSGRIQADGGTVTLSARSAEAIAASLVNNSGIVRANTLVERNGEVWITGDQVKSSGHIAVDAPTLGDAGRVVIKGGMATGSLQMAGTVSATAANGKGGQVETSAAHVAIDGATRVNTLSASGQHGTWTIDPTDFTVAAGSGVQTTSGIGAATLSANLDLGSVALVTAAGGTDAGDIFVQAPVSWTAGTTLTLTAERNININANLSASGLGASLVLTPGTAGTYSLGSGAKITLSGTQNTLQIAGVNYTLLRTLADVQAINASNTTRSGNYAMAVDIDATATSATTNPTVFTPIGNNVTFSSNNSFRGRFDGLGNSIIGLTVNQPNTVAVGLFGTAHDATIRNVNFSGGAFTGRQYVGAVAGYLGSNSSTPLVSVSNVSSNAPVSQTGTSANGLVGGLVGQLAATGGVITRSSSSGAVNTADSNASAGGLVGWISAGSVDNSSASGNVTSSNSANSRSMGGLVGYFDGTGTLRDSQASGNVNAAFNVGGLVGYYGSTGVITNVSATGSVTGTASGYAGGLIGDWNTAGSITTATATGAVDGSQYVGGLIGRNNNSGSLTGGTASGNVSSAYTSTAYIGGLIGSVVTNVAGTQINGNSGSSGTVTFTGGTGNIGGLVGYMTNGSIASSSSSSVVLATSTVDSRSMGGLVGYLDGTGTLSGVSATGSVTGGYNAGGLIGYFGSSGALTGATAGGNVTGTQYVGGLIGYATGAGNLGASGTTGAVRATGNVSGRNYAGGLVAYFTGGNITNASAIGAVAVTGTGTTTGYGGGLVGYYNQSSAGRSISGVSATGNVTTLAGFGSYGGLVGELQGASLSDATASGSVSGTNTIDSRTMGGLVGYFNGTGTMSTVGATGAVSGAYNVGGLVGYYSSTGALSGATATGNVSGTQYVGGLIGQWYFGGAISGATASGAVAGDTFAGGLIGYGVGSSNLGAAGTAGAVRAQGTTVSGGTHVGGLAGYLNNANITNASATAAVTSTAASNATVYAGGLVGYYTQNGSNRSISATSATGNVSSSGGYGDLGGLFGQLGGASLSTSSASGSVTATNTTINSRSMGGLVGNFGGTGTMSNVTASGAVSNGYNVGGLVGYYSSNGSLNLGTATGHVVGTQYVGGLIGQMTSAGGITDSRADGNVSTQWDGGGLVGYMYFSGAISDSRATGNVTGPQSAASLGGLVGYGYSNGNFSNVRADGNVSGGSRAGGLVGYLLYTNLDRGTAYGNVSVVSNSTAYGGGLVGEFYNYNAVATLTASSAVGNVYVDASTAYAGGLVGLMQGSATMELGTGSSASGRVSAVDSTNTSTSHYAGGLVGDFSGGRISNASASGAVISRYMAGGLVGNYSGSQVATNLNASGDVTVSGGTTAFIGGLAGYMDTAGLVTGTASGKVTTTATASSSAYAGGLVGYYTNSRSIAGAGASDLAASGDVSITSTSTSSSTFAGGLFGQFQDYVSSASSLPALANSHATGNVSGGANSGGLAGYFYTAYPFNNRGLRNSWASGNVQGSIMAGGLIGQFFGYGGIQDSWASGNVLGTGTGSTDRYLGGLIGQYNNYASTAGTGQLLRSYASGNVSLATGMTLTSSSDIYGGGLVGYLDGTTALVNLQDSYATGNVDLSNASGRMRAGGLMGYTDSNFANTYATGVVTATGIAGASNRFIGGLVAQRSGTTVTAAASFWDTTTSGVSSSALGTGVSTAQLRSATTFAGWDLASAGGSTATWRIYEGQTAPLLRGLLTPLTLSLANISKVYDGTASLGSAAINVGGTPVPRPERIFVAGVTPNAGTYSLTAANLYSQQNGYDLTLTGSADLTITPRTLTLSGLVANKVYDGTTTATLNTTPQLGGLVAGENLTFQPGSGFGVAFDTRTAGTGKAVTVSGSYTLVDGSNGLASNYVLPSAGTTTANITPAALTAGSFTATNRVYDGSTAVAVTATGATLTGVIGSDAVSVDLSSVNSGTVANKNVGTAKPVTVQGVSITGSDAGNYLLTGLDTVTVNITPKPVTVNGIAASDRQYNQGIFASLVTTGAALTGAVAGDQVLPKLDSLTGRVADKNVGNAKPVTITGLGLRGADAANYTVQQGSVAMNITPYLLTVALGTSSSTNKVYDGTTSAVTNWPVYWYGGDNLTVNSTSIGYVDKNVAYNSSNQPVLKNIVATGLTLSGTDAGNYALQNTSATAQGIISPKPLAVSGVTATNRVYDATRDVNVQISGATVDITAVVAGDVVSVATPGSGTVVGQMANKNVGTNKAVTVPGLTLTGTDAGNYTITSGTGGGVTVNITPKPLTAIYTAQNKVYDFDTFATMTVTSNDVIAGDNIVHVIDNAYCGNNACGYAQFTTSGFSGNGTFTSTRHVGNALPVVITYNELLGTDRANYTLLNPTGTSAANITPKPVTLAFNGVSKVYDGLDGATVTLNRGGSGVFGSDTLSTTQTAVYSGTGAKNVGTFKPISVTGITLSGADAGNYTVANTTATTTGTVTAKPITVSGITATDRPYDGTTTVAVTAGTVGSAGFVSGDTVSVSLPPGGISTGLIANRNVGTNKPVSVTGLSLTGSDAGNYLIDNTASGITVNIVQAALTPTFVGVSRVYNGGTAATVTSTAGGIVSGDQVTFSSLATYTGAGARNVGTNKPISVSNISISGSAAANYTLAGTTATAVGDITPKPATAVYSGIARVYSGAADLAAAVNGDSQQFVAGDAVGLSQTAVFADGNAGSNKPVTITGISLTGADAANYTLNNTSSSTTAAITPKSLGVTGVTATSRVYDGTTTVAVNLNNATVDTTQVIAGDQVSFTLPPGGITTGTLGDRNVGAAKPVNITGIALTGSSAANYALVGVTGLTASITPKPLTASYAAASKIYDGNADAAVTATSSDVLSIDSSSLGFNAQGVFSAGKNVGTGLQVAVSGTFLTGASRDNYALTNPSGSAVADITKRTVTALYGGTSRVYDGTTTAGVTSTLQGRVTGDQLSTTQTAEFTGAGARNVGNGKPISVSNADLTGADAGNYTLASATGSATGSITPKPITVDGLSNVLATDRVYDGTRNVVVTVPAGVTLMPDSADIITGDVVTIAVPGSGVTSGTMVNKNAGTNKAVTVDGLVLSGADAANYSIAGTSGVRVNITPLAITASFAGVNRAYNGNANATVTGSSTGVISGDSLSIQGSGTFADGKNVGTAKPIAVSTASLSGSDAGNYALLNTTGNASGDVTPLIITPAFTGGSRVYDGTTAAPVTGSTASFVVGDSVSMAGSGSFTGAGARNVGSGKAVSVTGITLSGSDAANYGLLTTTVATTATVTPRPLSLTGLTGVTATDRAYNGTTSVSVVVNGSGTVALDTSNVVPGDDVNVAQLVGNVTTGTVANKNVGTGKAVAVTGLALTGADAGNYAVAATAGVTVNITPKNLTATFNGLDKVYDGTAAASLLGSSTDIVAGDLVSISGSGLFSAGKNVGNSLTIAVTGGALTGLDASNYLLVNPSGTATAAITPRTVTATFLGGTRVYDGGTAAPVTGSASGFISGDSVTLAQTASFADKNVGTSKAVSVTAISLNGTDASNYQLANSSASTVASITPKPLGVQGLTGVTATDRAYDGTRDVQVTVGSTGTVTVNPADVVPGDTVTINAPASGVALGTMLDKNVGTAKPVTVAGLTLGGADAGNYSVASTSGVTVNITPRTLVPVYAGVNRVYDGTTAATAVGSSTGIVAGDSVVITGQGLFTGAGARNVGTAKPVTVTSGTLSSTDAGNYLLLATPVDTTADITPRTLSASYTGGTRVYDGTADASVTASTVGLIAGDAVTVTETASFQGAGARNVGTAKPVLVSGISLGGVDALNYALASTTATTTGGITPRALSVSGLTGITALDRVYDGTTAVQVQVSGAGGVASANVLPGDDVTVNVPGSGVGSGLMLDKNVGNNKPVTLSGLFLTGVDAGNYAITGVAGVTVNITPLSVTLSGVSAVDRVYDGTTSVALNTAAGSIGGVLAGDNVGLLSTGVAAVMNDKQAGSAKPVNVTGLALTGADAGNYTVAGGSGLTVNIAPRSLTAGFTVTDRIYNGDTNATVALTTNALPGDRLTLSAASARYATASAGTNLPVSVSGLALGDADAGNYVLVSTTLNGSGGILPAPLTVTARNASKVFGDTLGFAGSEFDSSGLVVGETLGQVALASAGSAASAAVNGSPYAVSVSGASGGSFNPLNYNISYVPGQLTVQPRPLTITANSLQRFASDAKTAVLAYSLTGRGLTNGDTLSAVQLTLPPGVDQVTGLSVFELRPTGATFGTGSAANYALSFNPGLLVVLPDPPSATDTNTAGAGGGSDLALVLGPEERGAALQALARASSDLNQAALPPGTRSALDQATSLRLLGRLGSLSAAELADVLSGDGRRVTVPTLQKMPLISLDPKLLRPVSASEPVTSR